MSAKEFWIKWQEAEGVRHHTVDDWPIRFAESYAKAQEYEWISVKDRLPEFKKSVQTWDGQKQWVDYLESVTEGRFHNRRNVTHWKPLSAPPFREVKEN